MFGGINMLLKNENKNVLASSALLAKDENRVETAKRNSYRGCCEESDFYIRHPECNDEYLLTDENEIDPKVLASLC